MRVKIIGKNTGLGNQIQFIPFINELKKTHEVISDSPVFNELGVLDKPSKESADINIVLFGYSYKKFWKERKAGKGKFVGFKYRIKKKHIGLGYHTALTFNQNLSEVENNRLLFNKVFSANVEKVDFSIAGKASVEKRVVIGISPKEEKTLQFDLWKAVIERLKSKGFEVQVVDHNIGVDEYVSTKKLRDLKSTIGSAQYYLGTDSGPMHLADILGIPSLVLFGSTDILKNGPQLAQSITYSRNLACSPCFDWGRVNCPINFKCMDFSIDDIMMKFDQLCTQ